MNKDIHKIILAIIIASIIIGLAVITAQIIKQSSIEDQKQMDIALEEKKIDAEAEKIKKVEDMKTEYLLLLDACLADGENIYWTYIDANGTDEGDGMYKAATWVWNEAEKRKQSHNDVCFKKYK